MLFDLDDLITPAENLGELIQEIDAVILSMPNDKAPGLDGFNSLFFKKCCHIIRNDIYSLCDSFFIHCADLKSINSSFITLVPKSAILR